MMICHSEDLEFMKPDPNVEVVKHMSMFDISSMLFSNSANDVLYVIIHSEYNSNEHYEEEVYTLDVCMSDGTIYKTRDIIPLFYSMNYGLCLNQIKDAAKYIIINDPVEITNDMYDALYQYPEDPLHEAMTDGLLMCSFSKLQQMHRIVLAEAHRLYAANNDMCHRYYDRVAELYSAILEIIKLAEQDDDLPF